MSNYRTAVSDPALQIASTAGTRTKHRNTPVRRAFIRRSGSSEPPPPMVRMLRGGRGGAVRLKLYLAIIWIAGGGRNAPFDTSIPARAWAELLDLPDPELNGARRVTDAIAWLDAHEFIQAVPQPGKPARTVLLHEGGSGGAYPGHPGSRQDPYVRLRSDFWERGWAAVLSGPAIAMLLLLLDWVGEMRSGWISPDLAVRHYALSEDSRTAGVAELRHHRLITVHRRLVSPALGVRRMRNSYTVTLERLQEAPGS